MKRLRSSMVEPSPCKREVVVRLHPVAWGGKSIRILSGRSDQIIPRLSHRSSVVPVAPKGTCAAKLPHCWRSSGAEPAPRKRETVVRFHPLAL